VEVICDHGGDVGNGCKLRGWNFGAGHASLCGLTGGTDARHGGWRPGVRVMYGH